MGRPCVKEDATAIGFDSPTHRARDLLPLPVGRDLTAILESEGLFANAWLADGIHHLNELGGGGRPCPRADQVASSQRKALFHLAGLYAQADVEACEWTPKMAFSSLMGMSSGYTDDVVVASGGTAVFKRGAKLALPSIPSGRVELMPSLKDRELLQQDTDLIETELAPFGPVALDAKLSLRGYDYGFVLEQLYMSKIIERGGACIERCGLFFVYKKDMSLRIIFDTRRSNCHFKPPPKTLLPSCECIGELETNADYPLFLASGDVEVCFYQYYLPEVFCDYFTLPSIESRFLSSSFRKQLGISQDFGQISFRVRVCPMGWNWAVALVQERQLHLLSTPGQPDHNSDAD
eukprot:1510749-Amphidinium_carterae.1